MRCIYQTPNKLVLMLVIILVLVLGSTAASADDDYGNTQKSAEKVSFGKTLQGTFDSPGEYDYFTFPARRGHGYIVTIETDIGYDITFEAPADLPERNNLNNYFDVERYIGDGFRRYTYWNQFGETDLFVRLYSGSPDPYNYSITIEESRDPQPEPRADCAMAFLPSVEKVILFGGAIRDRHFSDTWTWDGKNWKYLNVKGPSPRARHAMVTNEATGKILLFGGKKGTAKQFGDTWTFDGKRWKKMKTGLAPQAREGHAMAYDARRKVVVLYGGYQRTGQFDETEIYFDDIWEWDGKSWRRRKGNTPFEGRSEHIMAWDPGSSRMIIYGGHNESQDYMDDVWSWDGKRTSFLNYEFSSTPAPLASHAAFTVADENTIIIFSGETDEEHSANIPGNFVRTTWIFSKQSDDWTPYSHGRIPHASGVAATYDPVRHQGVAFGGWENNFVNNVTHVWTYKKKPDRWVWRKMKRR